MKADKLREERAAIRTETLKALDMSSRDDLGNLAVRADLARMPRLAVAIREHDGAEEAAERAHNALSRLVDP